MDKPEGPTSHDIVDAVRRALGVRRVGHAGTLDPFASGLLVVLVGRATRLARFLVSLRKTYHGIIRLGMVTDTDDRTGRPTATSNAWRGLDDHAIATAMTALTGAQHQRPPAFSAKKLAGERAHRLARSGRQVALDPRPVTVYRFDLAHRADADLGFAAEVSGGTYLRGLARDLGERLGCGAHLHELRRTAVGGFTVDAAATPEAVASDAAGLLRAPIDAVRHLPSLEVTPSVRDRVLHGLPLDAPEPDHATVALVHGDDLVAVAERQGAVLKPRVVLQDG